MKKHLTILIGILWAASLLLSACQPAAAPTPTLTPVTPTNTLAPADTPKPPTPTPMPDLQAQWTFKTEGPIWGTPLVDGGVVYAGSDDGNLYAVDAKTGQARWKFASGGIVRSRPAVSAGLVYFASDDGALYAINAQDGQQAWKTDIGNAYPRQKRVDLGNSPDPSGWDYVQSSPVVADGLVTVGSFDGNVYALSADSGKVAWTFKTGDKVRATPTIAAGVVYVGSWDMNFYALDAKTGQKLWAAPVGGQVQSTALVTDDFVVTASRKASVQAFDLKTGKLTWEYPYGGNMWVESSPRLVGDKIYIGSSGSQVVVGMEAKTGKPYTAYMSRDFHWSTPLVVKDMLYIGGASFGFPGALYAMPLKDGKLPQSSSGVSQLKVSETLEYSGKITGVAGSPVLADGVIYVGGLDGKLYAVKE